MKIEDRHFNDWYFSAFGSGYGTGERQIIPALKKFFDTIYDDFYTHTKIENVFGSLAGWLLISVMSEEGILDYGTSIRYGWLTSRGKRLRDFIASKSEDELITIVTARGKIGCYRDCCQCGTKQCNPFWNDPK